MDECGPTHHACACQLERLDRLEAEVERLRGALQRIATYEVPGTGVYRNTDAAEYARRVLAGDTQ